MGYQSIKKWPEGERPRERLLKYGADTLSDSQLLAIILRTGGGGKSALDLALEMLNELKDLRGIEEASLHDLSLFKGMGLVKIAQLRAAFELGQRLQDGSREQGPVFSSGSDVYSFYARQYQNRKKEEFRCAMLNAKNRLIKDYRISEGTLTGSMIHPREAFCEAIRESAASVIFVHNHPSGDPAPSREDISATERLVNAGELIGIKVLDHVIIGKDSYTSMMEKGYINNRK